MIVATALSLALAPYRGAPLRGSIPHYAKFAVAIHGKPNATYALTTVGLPHAWIVSFCTNLVCAPIAVHVTLPASGRLTIEMQLIPKDDGAVPPRTLTVVGNGSVRASIAYARGTH